MLTTKAHRTLLAAAVIAVFAAMPAGATATPNRGVVSVEPGRPIAAIVVRNYNSLDVQVFAVTAAGKRFELGRVNRDSERTFELPNRIVENNSEFRLKVYSLARGVPTSVIDNQLEAVKTQLLSPSASDEIVLTVKSPLLASFIDYGSTTPN